MVKREITSIPAQANQRERYVPYGGQPVFMHECDSCGMTNPDLNRKIPENCEWCGTKMKSLIRKMREQK